MSSNFILDTPWSPSIEGLQVAFDNTSLSLFKECPRKYKYALIEGYRPHGTFAPLSFGKSYHDCLEVFETSLAKGATRIEALRLSLRRAFAESEGWPLEDTRRTRLTLLRSLVWYSENYSNDSFKTHTFSNGRIGLELSFRFELPLSSPNGTPYLYAGHIDKVASYGGRLFAMERKHTVSALNDQFFDRYTFSSQVSGYVYAGNVCLPEPLEGAIIDATQVGVNFTRFGRRIVQRVLTHIEEWMGDTAYWIKKVEESALTGTYPHNTESCSKYNGCQFQRVCKASPSIRPLILQNDFRVEHWNPLKTRGD